MHGMHSTTGQAGPESGVGAAIEARSGATQILLAFALWGVAVVLVGSMPGTSIDARVTLVSLAATFVGVGSFLLVTRHVGGLAALGSGKLSAWSSLSFALFFGLASLTWVEPQTGLPAAIDPESVVRALELLMLGQVVWTAGFVVGPGRGTVAWASGQLLRLLDAKAAGRTGANAAWALFAVAVAGHGLRVVTGAFGYLQDASVAVVSGTNYAQFVGILAAMGDFALVTAAYHLFRRDGDGSRFQVFVIASFLALVGVLAGTKQPAAMVGVDLILAFAVARRRFPTRMAVVGVVLFLVAVLPFVTAYRHVVRGQQTLSVSEAIQTAPEVARESTGVAEFAPSVDILRVRLRQIDNVAIIVQKTPDIVPFRPLSEFALAPAVGIVPRAIWTEKPVFATGYNFAREYLGQGSTTYSSSAISPQGDLLRHGGLPVLVFGMLFVGIAVRFFDETLRPDLDFRALFFVIMVLPMAAKQEQDMVTFLLSVPAYLLTPLVGIWLTGLVGEPSRKRGHG